FVERLAQQRIDEPFITDLLAEAADHRGDLRVEDRRRQLAVHLLEKDFKVLAAGVEYFDNFFVEEQIVQRREVHIGRERINRHRIIRPGHLYKAQPRPVSALADKLRVDSNELRLFKRG